MVKVKALINFNDYEAGVYRDANKEFECSEERAKVLAGDNKDKIIYAEIIEKEPVKEIDELEEQEEEKQVVEEKPKRKKKKIDTVE